MFIQSKLDLLQPIPGDEPIMYVDSKISRSREESVQKRYYQRGYHKKTGKYASAVEHLIETNCSQGEDDTNNTPKTSNRTIDLSKVDFGYNLQLPPTDTPPENSMIDGENQVGDSTDVIPRELKNKITSVPLSEEYTVSIDGDYVGYNDVVNRITAMYAKIGSYNNGDIDVDWFEVLDILSVQI